MFQAPAASLPDLALPAIFILTVLGENSPQGGRAGAAGLEPGLAADRLQLHALSDLELTAIFPPTATHLTSVRSERTHSQYQPLSAQNQEQDSVQASQQDERQNIVNIS